MIEDIAKGINSHLNNIGHNLENIDIGPGLAKAAIVAALPHIKEAMEYHGVQGAMNKMIIKRIEDQCK